MGNRDDFLMLVQTILVREPKLPLVYLWKAQAFNDEHLPTDVYAAACDFIVFMKGGRKPDWVQKAEDLKESFKLNVKIGLNIESDADGWWMTAESVADDMPESCRPIVCDRVEFISVSKHDAEAFIDWASQIPGWDFACPPFTFHNVSDGKEFKPKPTIARGVTDAILEKIKKGI
jgi:hypothetical protein